MNVRIEHVSKQYGKRLLFDIENLELVSGKLYGLVGSNGVGKTTLLKILAGLDTSKSAKIFYDGELWHKGLIQDITYLTQKAYMMNATVFENVAWPLRVREIAKAEQVVRVTEALERLEILGLAERNATTLSGGESQKVALARALVFEPKLLLMDEPAASLDQEASKLFESRLLAYLLETKATVIFVTHSTEQAMRCCNELIWLAEGTVRRERL